MLYWSAPTAAELAGSAYKVSDFPEPHVDVWDENWDVLHLFRLYSTQWRVSMGGPVGLDFSVLHHALDRKGIKGDEYDTYIANLRIIESAALQQIHKGS